MMLFFILCLSLFSITQSEQLAKTSLSNLIKEEVLELSKMRKEENNGIKLF